MNSFLGFLKKEFYHIFRDKRSMIILFGMPIVQLLLFGFVITTDLKDVMLAVVDYSHDEHTREIVQKITSSGYFKLVRNLDGVQQVDDLFRQGDVKVVMVFEPDFGKKLEVRQEARVQLLTDASEPNMASMEVNYLQGILQSYNARLNVNVRAPYYIEPRMRMFYNPELKSVMMFVPGIMAMILMLVSAMITSISIAREKELGTMEVLLVSPLRPLQIILGKVTPYLLLSFINAVVIIAMGNFVFGVPVQGNLVLLLAESMLFILLALSLGILISTIAKSQQVAMMLSMFALMLPTILLSGFIFPIRNMPWILQVISNLMPPKWFIIIVKNIMLKGTGFGHVWLETLILFVMTLVFIGLSVKKFKVRLE
ncbi:MAG: ABC transporter permease [Marinifilaceae bacterium]